jgi:hypothetical protein
LADDPDEVKGGCTESISKLRPNIKDVGGSDDVPIGVCGEVGVFDRDTAGEEELERRFSFVLLGNDFGIGSTGSVFTTMKERER